MRILQNFTLPFIFTLILSLQLHASKINHILLVECASIHSGSLLHNFSEADIVKTGNVELTDCPPDKKYCVGIITFIDGSVYNGEISYGKPNGRGIMTWPDKSYYIGAFVKGERNGSGEFHFRNGNRYEGEWKNGKMNGQGAFMWANGAEYFGYFQNNIMQGMGSIVLDNNESYSGEWNNNLPEGQGCFTQNNGSTYIGSIKEGLRDGEGKIIWENGDTILGNWADGKFDGDVMFQYHNGDQLNTEWKNGQIADQSTYKSSKGKVVKGDLEEIQRILFFDDFDNTFASNLQFTYYSIGLEFDASDQYEKATEYLQMAFSIESDENTLDKSINRRLYELKEKQKSGWAKLNKQKN